MKLLLLFLFLTTPAVADDHYCKEIHDIMLESVKEGVITHKEAVAIYGRCTSVEFE